MLHHIWYMTEKRHRARTTKASAQSLLNDIRQYVDTSSYLAWSEKDQKYILLGSNTPRIGLVDCPQCRVGRLMVVRSRSTGKRFVGCSNYLNGCTASSPLLQRARLRVTKKACRTCGWPEVIFRYSNKQKWSRQCSNILCATRNGSDEKSGGK